MLKFNDPDYMLRCVIMNTVHAKTLIFAVENDFVGDDKKRIEEARRYSVPVLDCK